MAWEIWKFYVAITAVLHDLFTVDTLSIPEHVRNEVSAIVNKRYDEMIHGLSGDLFFRAFSWILVLAKEIQSGREAPEFARYSTAAGVMAAFKTQFESYTRQNFPVSVWSEVCSKVIEYWRSLAPNPQSGALAFVAIKVFSILANSMPEERTVSRFTRIDTPDRSSHGARTIVRQTQIYQHNRRKRAAMIGAKRTTKSPSLKWRSVKALFTPVKPPNAPIILDGAAETRLLDNFIQIDMGCDA
ncbi:hypothetical protein B0H14DRAFT_3441496 [Mycena olivaceomarginata]|nr:hypothetical protein B0H14DRAFT_3441496 [Mycena olivaceomarginata]